MRLAFASNADGSQFLPAFTDEAALLRFAPKGGYWASAPLSHLRDVLAASPFATLVIDPESPTQRVIRRDDPRDG